METTTPGGYCPRLFVSDPEPDSLTERLKQAHDSVIAILRKFLARKSSGGSLTSLADELRWPTDV
jgi:hypothetical protein